MSSDSSHGGGDALAGLNIEIHPVSLDGLRDSDDKQSKKAASQDDARDGKPKPDERKPTRPSRRTPRADTPDRAVASKPERREPARKPKPEKHPKGTRPSTRAPKRPITPKPAGRPRRGISPKFKAGAGAAAGLAMAPGMDWRQATKDPKAALGGLKNAAVQAGKDKLAGMMDPANLSDTVSQVRDSAAGVRDRAGKAKDRSAGGKVDTKGLKDQSKALKDKSAGLKNDLKAIKDHESAGKKMSGKVGGVAKNLKNLTKAIRTGSIVQKVIGAASMAWSVIQQVLNGVWNASPAGWVTLAIGAAIIAITLVITHWDEIKAAFSVVKKNVLEPIGQFFEKVFGEVFRPFIHIGTAVTGAVGSVCSTVKGVFTKVRRQVAVIAKMIADKLDFFSFVPGIGTIVDLMSNWADAHMADGGLVGGHGGASTPTVGTECVVAESDPAREAVRTDHLRVAGRDIGLSALKRSPHIAPTRGVHRTATRTRDVDHSTTIALDRRTDGAFGRTRSLHAQRALTYAGGLR